MQISKQSKSKKLFENNYKLLLNRLSKKEYTLFENISSDQIIINLDKEYQKFTKSPFYYELITENNDTIRNKMMKLYILESISDSVLFTQYQLLQENEEISLTKEVLFETTLTALEEEFFNILNIKKGDRENFKEIFETIMIQTVELNENEYMDKTKSFFNKFLEFMKRTKEISFGLLMLIFFLVQSVFITLNTTVTAIIKSVILDLFHIQLSLKNFDQQVLTAKVADPIVKEFLNKHYGFSIDDLIKKCWKINFDKYKTILKKSNLPILDKINDILFTYSNKRIFNSSLNNPLFYTMWDKNLFKDQEFIELGHNINICVFNKLKDFAVALAISTFEMGEVSEKLMRNLTSKNDILRVASNFKQLYQSSSQNLNKAEKVFIESILFLTDLKILIDKILQKKERLNYKTIQNYETINKSITMSLKEIEEAYRRSKNFKDQKIQKYEENNKQNREKTLAGNAPTKPKKENLFDI